MTFSKDVSCYDYENTYLEVLHVGDYYLLTKEMIYIEDATEKTVFWRNVALTRYEIGKIISIKVTQFYHFKTF